MFPSNHNGRERRCRRHGRSLLCRGDFGKFDHLRDFELAQVTDNETFRAVDEKVGLETGVT